MLALYSTHGQQPVTHLHTPVWGDHACAHPEPRQASDPGRPTTLPRSSLQKKALAYSLLLAVGFAPRQTEVKWMRWRGAGCGQWSPSAPATRVGWRGATRA